MICKNCNEEIIKRPYKSARYSLPIYVHKKNEEHFCKKEGVPKYASAEPIKRF